MVNQQLREQLYKEHILYFKVLQELGNGIMIKPHLEQYIIAFCNYGKSKFEKVIKKLAENKLLCVERTNSASIVMLTKPALALLKNKEVEKVSTSSIRTNLNLKKSMMKNEYILQNYRIDMMGFREVLKMLKEEGNLISKVGDNEHIAKAILAYSTGTYAYNLEHEYEYLKAVKINKIAQLKNNDIEKVDVRDKNASINNLQARHMYITQADLDLEIAYFEMTKHINYEKFRADFDILSKCLQFIQCDHVTINIIIETNRVRAVTATAEEWKRKRLIHFLKLAEEVTINIVPVDIQNKYLRGVDICL